MEPETSELKEDPLYLTEENEAGPEVLVVANTRIDSVHRLCHSSKRFLDSAVRTNTSVLTDQACPAGTVPFHTVSSQEGLNNK